jgi:hypothetical protein
MAESSCPDSVTAKPDNEERITSRLDENDGKIFPREIGDYFS